MTARIIDGKTIAAELRGRVADAAHRLARDRALVPGLAVVLVGNNPASEIYVGSKTKATVGSGMRSFDHRLPATVSEADLLTLVGRLNRDPVVHGILVQLPLPAAYRFAEDHRRDRSGQGRGRLPSGQSRTAARPACRRSRRARRSAASFSPRRCIRRSKDSRRWSSAAPTWSASRSRSLLLAENATVTIAHSKTADLPAVCRRADLVFAAVGRPEMVRKGWIKPGATVIDVGITRACRARAASRSWSAMSPLPRHPRSRVRSRRCRAASVR